MIFFNIIYNVKIYSSLQKKSLNVNMIYIYLYIESAYLLIKHIFNEKFKNLIPKKSIITTMQQYTHMHI